MILSGQQDHLLVRISSLQSFLVTKLQHVILFLSVSGHPSQKSGKARDCIGVILPHINPTGTEPEVPHVMKSPFLMFSINLSLKSCLTYQSTSHNSNGV